MNKIKPKCTSNNFKTKSLITTKCNLVTMKAALFLSIGIIKIKGIA